MDNIFLIKLFLSFVVGGAYIAFSLWVSEKFGSRIGGLLLGLPSTILVGLIFIAWTQNTTAAVVATSVAPATLAANSLFLVTFIHLYKKAKALAFFGAFSIWFILTLPFVFFHLNNIFISLFFACIFFSLAIYYLKQFPHRKIPKFKLSKSETLFRIIFAGFFVSFAVFLGKVWGPLWGGMFASFPAAFSSSLLLIERKHGIDFASSVARTMPYGSIGSVIFTLFFYFLVPSAGIVWATTIAYAASFIYALLIDYFFLKRQNNAVKI